MQVKQALTKGPIPPEVSFGTGFHTAAAVASFDSEQC